MKSTARLLTPLAVFLFPGCANFNPLTPAPIGTRNSPPPVAADPLPAGALLPSSNLLVGRVVAIDPARGFAFVELTSSPPAAALADGAILVSRTDDLRETARLSTSRYVRGRTLGVRVISGQPAPGNEVVWPTL
jgi:hypothetical protein